MQEGVRDLLGKDIRVGAIVAFSMNSYGGYLGVGLVLEVLTEVLPFHLKVRVMKASKRKGPQAGTVLILGNAFHRAQDPEADLDTVLVLDLVGNEIRFVAGVLRRIMKKPLISDESLVSLATNLYQAHSGSREVPEEERAYWVKLARVAAAFFRTPFLEPGMKSHLVASRELPRTLVEVVAVKYSTRVTIKLPDGTLVEADEDALVDWGADFGWTYIEDGKEGLLHIDTFRSEHGAHPLTGEPWRGRILPDALKAYSLLRDPEAQVQGKGK